MGLFRREPTIGRSTLTKSELERLLDLNNEYRTDYTYVTSKSYRPNGSVYYENPRMFRMPLESFRRRRAFDTAWKSSYIHYLYLCIKDYLSRFIANPARMAGAALGSVFYFLVQMFWTLVYLIPGMRHRQGQLEEKREEHRMNTSGHRYSQEHEQQFEWTEDNDEQLGEEVRRRSAPLHTATFANEMTGFDSRIDQTATKKKASKKQSIAWRVASRLGRLATYAMTLGMYPQDFDEGEPEARESWMRTEVLSAGGVFSPPVTRTRTRTRTTPRRQQHSSFTEFEQSTSFSAIAPGPSGDTPGLQQISTSSTFTDPLPPYEDTWETDGGTSGIAPRMSTPKDPTELRRRAAAIVLSPIDNNAARTESAVGSSFAVFGTFISEIFTCLSTIGAMPYRAVRYAGGTVVDFMKPSSRREVAYNLRSRTVPAEGAAQYEPNPVPLFERSVAAISRGCKSGAKTVISTASSIVLAPIYATTYVVSKALLRSPAKSSAQVQSAAAGSSSRSDYMVGRAFGKAAELPWALLMGLATGVGYLLSMPMRAAGYVRHTVVPAMGGMFTESDEEPVRHRMTLRSSGNAAATSLPATSRPHKKKYAMCLWWLIPLIIMFLLLGMFAKKCRDDPEVIERMEMLQYPTIVMGHTYGAASTIWLRMCALVIRTGNQAYEAKESVITSLASQQWTSQEKLGTMYESTRKSITTPTLKGLSYVRLRLLALRDYVWGFGEKAYLVPDYAKDTGNSISTSMYDFIIAIIDALRQVAHSVWENVRPLFFLLRSKWQNWNVLWSEPICKTEVVSPTNAEFDGDRSGIVLTLDELKREKTKMGVQLEELRRERELDELRYQELRKAIEVTHTPLPEPTIVEELHVKASSVNEDALNQKIEQHIHNYVTNLKVLDDSVINQRLVDMESRLVYQLEKLSQRLESDIDVKLDDAKKESGHGHKTLSTDISDLALAISTQRGEFETYRKERDSKLAELARAVMLVETGQAEGVQRMKVQINELIRDEVTKGLSVKLTSLTEKSEKDTESLRGEIYKQIESRVMALFAAQITKSAQQSASKSSEHVVKVTDVNGLSQSDLLVIRKLIIDALHVYDADKTGKVDYALESSGGSILSTCCTEPYQETSRLESIFGIPLWFSSYSPRIVIQHRSNALSSGECWAFRGPGHLTIKLSMPIHITEVSYEHLRKELHPDGVMRSAPKKLQIWGMKTPKDTESKILLGDFEFDREGDPLQFFKMEEIPEHPVQTIELVVKSNWGADYTCLYRFRVHGKPPHNETASAIDNGDEPLVDKPLYDDLRRETKANNN